MIITAPPLRRRAHLDLTDRLMAAGLLDEEVGAELTAPRQLSESPEEYAARVAAREDITADLRDEYLAGSCGDPWFETDPDDWPDYDEDEFDVGVAA